MESSPEKLSSTMEKSMSCEFKDFSSYNFLSPSDSDENCLFLPHGVGSEPSLSGLSQDSADMPGDESLLCDRSKELMPPPPSRALSDPNAERRSYSVDMTISGDATATTLANRPKLPAVIPRSRSYSLPDIGSRDCFVQLESTSGISKVADLHDLPVMVSQADGGMKSGIDPILADGAMGGTYFLRDKYRSICVVCKPGDEEPNAPWNPHQQGTFGHASNSWASFKGHIIPGFGMYREVAVFLLDRGFAGVPPTQLARVRHQIFKSYTSLTQSFSPSAEAKPSPALQPPSAHSPIILPLNLCASTSLTRIRCSSSDSADSGATSSLESVSSQSSAATSTAGLGSSAASNSAWASTFSFHKKCSVQVYVRHECSAEDMGPSRFNCLDVQKIAVLDIRTCNLDRHEGNMLVARTNPYCTKSSASNGGDVMHAGSALIPIDHGYCLPHILGIQAASFAWMNWPQCREASLPEVKAFVEAMDVNEDIAMLQKCLGAALSEPYLLTLRVCTMLLKRGIAAGLTLYDIGSAMVEYDDFSCDMSSASSATDDPAVSTSLLHRAVQRAIQKTNASAAAAKSRVPESAGLSPKRSPILLACKSAMNLLDTTPASPPGSTTSSLAIPVLLLPPLQSPSQSASPSSRARQWEKRLYSAMMYESGRVLLSELDIVVDGLVARLLKSSSEGGL